MSTYRITTRIVDTQWPREAVLAVLPIPPATALQRPVGALLPCAWEPAQRTAVNVAQSALFVELRRDLLGSPYSIDIVTCAGRTPEDHYAEAALAGFEPDAGAATLYETLGLAALPERTRLLGIVRCMSGRSAGAGAATLFGRLLRLGGIRHAHYNGYAVGDDAGGDGCRRLSWFDTLTERGLEGWDVAPCGCAAGGARVALGTGASLLFDDDGDRMQLPALCEPRWILSDGCSRPCRVSVSAQVLRRDGALNTHLPHDLLPQPN